MNIAQPAYSGYWSPSAAAPRPSSVPFWIVILYVSLEFGRPQELVPGIAVLHLPGIATVLLTLALVLSRRVTLADPQTKLFLLLLCLMAFHIPLAVNTYWAVETTRAMAQTFVAYLALVAFVDSFAKLRTFVAIWLVVHVYLALTGIVQRGRGIGGFLGDENEFAMALNMALPFAFFLAIAETGRLKRIMYLVLAGLFVFTSIMTFSRAGFLGLIAVAAYCWLISPRKIVSAVLLASLALFAVQAAPAGYWDEIRSIKQGASDPTGEDRIYQWRIGWRMFLDNPLLGVGPNNFAYEFRTYEIAAGFEEGLHTRSRAGRAAHSLYFTLLPELGLAGTLTWAGMLSLMYADRRRARESSRQREDISPDRQAATRMTDVRCLSLAMAASLVAYLAAGVFNSVFYYPNFWILMGLGLALRKTAASTA
jgi:O-antigen ligase